MHQNSRRSIEAEYNRIAAEKADKSENWMLVWDLGRKEIALKAVEPLNFEKVENLWRRACAPRWQCYYGKALPALWLTEREKIECQFVKGDDRGPLGRLLMTAMRVTPGTEPKRRQSFS
jgi:hypothetical protein